MTRALLCEKYGSPDDLAVREIDDPVGGEASEQAFRAITARRVRGKIVFHMG